MLLICIELSLPAHRRRPGNRSILRAELDGVTTMRGRMAGAATCEAARAVDDAMTAAREALAPFKVAGRRRLRTTRRAVP
jgi:hypothetical protein